MPDLKVAVKGGVPWGGGDVRLGRFRTTKDAGRNGMDISETPSAASSRSFRCPVKPHRKEKGGNEEKKQSFGIYGLLKSHASPGNPGSVALSVLKSLVEKASVEIRGLYFIVVVQSRSSIFQLSLFLGWLMHLKTPVALTSLHL